MLTEAGRRVLAEGRPLWQRAQAVFEKEIGAKDATELRAMLNRVPAARLSMRKKDPSHNRTLLCCQFPV